MKASLRDRYGYEERITDPRKLKKAIGSLIDGLCREEFPRPDYEHSQISVVNEQDWGISVYLRGFVELHHLTDFSIPSRYRYGLSKEELIELLLLLAQEKMEEVFAQPWQDSTNAFTSERDYYLLLGREDLTDLHRAAAKGDCEWAKEELKTTDVNIEDKWGATPLHHAAFAGHPDMCLLLLQHEADINATDTADESVFDYANMSQECATPKQYKQLQAILKEWQ